MKPDEEKDVLTTKPANLSLLAFLTGVLFEKKTERLKCFKPEIQC